MKIVWFLLLAGCVSSMPGSSGNGNMNDALEGGTAPQASTCTPSTQFCDGSWVWTCNRSGTDAWGGTDCSAIGSANNPYMCATAGCAPIGSKTVTACCLATKPLCAWDLKGERVMKGSLSSSTGVTPGYTCTPPASIASGCSAKVGTFVVSVGNSPIDVCTAGSDGFTLVVDRTTLTVGQAIAMPSSTVLEATLITAGNPQYSCSQWTGTITINQDAPSYLVTLNLTCSESGKTAIGLTGTIQGDV